MAENKSVELLLRCVVALVDNDYVYTGDPLQKAVMDALVSQAFFVDSSVLLTNLNNFKGVSQMRIDVQVCNCVVSLGHYIPSLLIPLHILFTTAFYHTSDTIV
jgi:hypothetical protein